MEALWKQAMVTFKLHSNHFTPTKESFEKLKNLADRITAADLKLDKTLLSPQSLKTGPASRLREPPVTYIEIFEDTNFTMGVFILKPGAKIPLHDHPNMHGILKVIAGKVQIQCYNLGEKHSGRSDDPVHFAEKLPKITVGEDDESCILTPERSNLHEIETVDGGAAFFDILAPPYESKLYEGENKCHYYKELPLSTKSTQENTPKTMLLQVPSPPDFWSDSAPYLGPPLRLSLLQKLINFNAWPRKRVPTD